MQMSYKQLHLGLMLLAAGMLAGCGGNEEPSVLGSQPVVQPVPGVASMQVAPPPVAPPPGIAGAVAMPASTELREPMPIANDGSLASYVTGRASAYFQDRDGEFDVASAQEMMERAVMAYREIQSTKHDDSPDWPVFNDLSLLVKYKILRALPPAPEGQRFVYDAATRKVLLATN